MINKRNSVFSHGIAYLGIRAITAQTRILGGVRTLYLWSKEKLVHLLERHAEEVLNDSWSLWVELPQTERSTFARRDLEN